jgi:hypothetical protein
MGKKTKLLFPKTFSYTFLFYYQLDRYIEDQSKNTCIFEATISNKKRNLHLTDNEDWQKLVKYIKKDVVPEILYYDDFIFKIPDKIQFIKKEGNEVCKYSNDINQDINDTWQLVLDDILTSTNPQFKSFQERIVDNWNDDLSLAKQHLSEMEGKLNEIITRRWKELFNNSGKKLNFEKIQLNCMPDGKYLNVSFDVITTTHKSFRIDERSKGCKWFFSFLLFTEFRKNRTKNILFLLDEPASNLHSSAQHKILEAIRELSNNSLVIYATHSHHLIKIDWLTGAYIVINEILDQALDGTMIFNEKINIYAEKFYSYIGNGHGNDKVSYFQPILEALDYAPSTVEPIPNICILEGKNDWFTFMYFKEFVLKDTYSYNFYPGAGANKLWDIIRLYLAWGKDFIIILDGDKAGIEAKKEYIEEFGTLIEHRIYTLYDILNIQNPTETLIEENDKQTICNECYGISSVTKKNLNFAINQLFSTKREVQISSVTKSNFETVFDFIRDYYNKK